jgi:hypothetical protein
MTNIAKSPSQLRVNIWIIKNSKMYPRPILDKYSKGGFKHAMGKPIYYQRGAGLKCLA